MNKVSVTFRPTRSNAHTHDDAHMIHAHSCHTTCACVPAVCVDTTDKVAKFTIDAIRFNFDVVSGYMWGKLTPKKCLTRIVFLESVAGTHAYTSSSHAWG